MTNFTLQEKEQFGNILSTLADSIDLTEPQYKLAIERYKAVADFLSGPTSLLYRLKPVIKPQGSIRIGTPVRPISDDLEFDVDLTCLLQAQLPNIQSYLKNQVGLQLKSDKTYKSMLEEMRRCWRLKYAESSRFHLDIVPAIPDGYQWLLNLGVSINYAQHAIHITDNERINYDNNTYDFPKSNPEGYALWFLDIMKIEADRIRMQLKQQLLLERIEDVPEYKVRTPLQRGVQLMKRHRDIMFQDKEDCPISIILTTLAARAYAFVLQNQKPTLFYDVLIQMVEAMPRFIEVRNGIKWIPNPVNPHENFADKWQSNKQKEQNFFHWHAAFLHSLKNDSIQKGSKELGDVLKESFGSRAVNEAFNKIGTNARQLRETGNLRAASTGIIGSAGTLIKAHTFHGKK